MRWEQLTWATIMLPADDGEIPVIKAAVISDKYIEQILRYGSNTENARLLIVAEYSKGKTDNTEFLKEMYHGGFGILTADGNVEVEWEDRVLFRKGETIKIMSWEDIDGKIKQMLDDGIFATQAEIDSALEYDRKDFAETLVYMIRDTETEYEHWWNGLENTGCYPVMVEATQQELTSNPAKIVESVARLRIAEKQGKQVLRFARLYNLEKTLTRARENCWERKKFTGILPEDEEIQPYITDYEIDKALGGGSGISGGKQRITAYFEKEKDRKKRQEFLKNEYGIGGRSHAVSGANHSGENHDGKGIELVKGDCRVMMNWSQVERKIDTMIKENRYGV